MRKSLSSLFLLFILAIVLTNCVPTEENKVIMKESPEEAIIVLNQQLDEIELLCLNFVLDDYLLFFDQDAMIMPPSQPPIQGINAIRDFLSEFDEVFIPSFEGKYTERSFEVTDSLAVRRYKSFARILYRNSSDTLISDNTYMDVLKKQADGSWKIIWQMWNTNKPAQ